MRGGVLARARGTTERFYAFLFAGLVCLFVVRVLFLVNSDNMICSIPVRSTHELQLVAEDVDGAGALSALLMFVKVRETPSRVHVLQHSLERSHLYGVGCWLESRGDIGSGFLGGVAA